MVVVTMMWRNRMTKKKSRGFCAVINICIIVLVFVVFPSVSHVRAADSTPVNINPASQTVSAGDTFVITVECLPQQPVKAFELKMSFNPSLLQATAVVEGNLFDGYMTFFNAGEIDNTAGTIIKVYNLIVGPGNVTSAGSFVTINFTARSMSGTSALNLYDVRVTNESDYIDINVVSGSVTVTGGTTPPPENPPPSEPPENPPASENTPPYPPTKPVGPTLVELGISYSYSSAAIDSDGDQVRLRFDWGDGLFSNWTYFVASNTSVSVSHVWENVSNYTIRVIAQDENGSNSSWSDPLTVIVSQQTGLEGIPPVGVFSTPGHASTNQTIVFDASGSYDEDGVIVSYEWNFGDGATATGKQVSHTYLSPEQYIVTLKVTDNSGMTSTSSQVVSIMLAVITPAESWIDYIQAQSSIFIILFALVTIFGLLVVFRTRIRDVFVRRGVETSQRKLAQFDSDSVDIDALVDAFFSERKRRPEIPIKEAILNAYNDLIIAKIEKNIAFQLPYHNFDEVERLVDQLILAKIRDEVDKL
jgi:chitodextrinase